MRKSFIRVHRSQRIFLYPVVAAFFLGCALSLLSLMYFLVEVYVFYPENYWFQNIIPAILAAISVFLVAVIIWTLRISSCHVGYQERIIRELDEVLDGEREGPLTTRKADVLFTELLKRINNLIERRKS